ncbi:heat shock protein 70kda [Holotrichia oblita]|uniref:Heat shock protein 70kda n=1 Tax=Holotrichia oblita TaxID=644536 RepID=A0ACB9SR33_HOLOL|nr:heat shock protein 70kda [Holotrichia oblita]
MDIYLTLLHLHVLKDIPVADMKRLIGRRYTDESVQSDMKKWLFNVISDDGFPKVAINTNGIEKTFKPEDISAMVLRKMKSTAETYLESRVEKAVITVPASFTNRQRQETLQAGRIAGLKAIKLLNEPTAAAIAYAVIKEKMRGTILIYDLGGGTLDVSILTVTDTCCSVKATHGNTHLGGEDFNNNILEYLIHICQEKYKKNVRNDKRAMALLREQCESVKKKLSVALNVRIFIDSLIDGVHFDEILTRDKFNKLNSNLFESTLQPVMQVLHAAQINKQDVDKVVMVGGSSRIPKLRNLLEQFFDGKDIHTSINPDEVVAYGASIYAAICNNITIRDRSKFEIQDITSISLGLRLKENMFLTVIKRHTSIPCSHVKKCIRSRDNPRAIYFPIYEGESSNCKENNLLERFLINSVPDRSKGQEIFYVTFSVDNNGILKVAINISYTQNKAGIITPRKSDNYK